MTEEEFNAVVITLGLLLDQIQAKGDAPAVVEREAVSAIGSLLADRGGLKLMDRAMHAVLDQKPDDESWREGVIDRRWSGYGGWMS